MEVRQFTVRDALAFLGIKPPRIKKSMSQKEINDLVRGWKDTTLKDHYKQERIKAHPDRREGDADRFKSLEHAYEEIKEHLVLRKPRIPPSEIIECPGCKAARVPKDAHHCHHCGKKYDRDEPRTICPVCGSGREPKDAKFCHGCGYDYQVPDYFLERLMGLGLSKHDIQSMEGDGTLDKLRALNPLDPRFNQEVEMVQALRKLRQRGMF